ncbi:metallophosphoesterase [Clostridium sediminicola]|uniref:YfcE family phosphodiesterase n=1 Tax=Clostridium sediminicola TaxID=3114879 RepID=UPI0031F256A8
MEIAVISDTHRYTYVFDKLIRAISHADVLIHLGDNVQDLTEITRDFKGEVYNVRGNCDYNTRVPIDRFEEIGGINILLTHGHKYHVKDSMLNLKHHAMEIGADLVLFGHTHVSEILFEEGIWFVNPGSPSLSRDGYNSYAIIKVENNKINPSIRSL